MIMKISYTNAAAKSGGISFRWKISHTHMQGNDILKALSKINAMLGNMLMLGKRHSIDLQHSALWNQHEKYQFHDSQSTSYRACIFEY
jgi:hypothetical protein